MKIMSNNYQTLSFKLMIINPSNVIHVRLTRLIMNDLVDSIKECKVFKIFVKGDYLTYEKYKKYKNNIKAGNKFSKNW